MTIRHAVPVTGPSPQRDRAVVATGIVTLTALAWLYLASAAWGPGGMSGDDGAGPGLVLVMWVVMMVAMMVPSAAPLVLMFVAVNRRRGPARHRYFRTTALLAGYLGAWAGFAVLAAGAQWGLHQLGTLSSPMGGVSPLVGGAVLVTAGTFQWSPLKRACLRHCRGPLGFLISQWSPGMKGALVMGLRHGTFCLGCCWALMSLMFVGGVMSLAWMAGIATYVAVEKLFPDGHRIAHLAGLALVAWGLWTLTQAL